MTQSSQFLPHSVSHDLNDNGTIVLRSNHNLGPVAEKHALVPEARDRLKYCAGKTRPAMVFARDAAMFSEALAMDVFKGVQKVVSTGVAAGMTSFADLAQEAGPELDQAYANVGPETVVKILFTSGSTSNPKGVPKTQKMLCANQAQWLAALPILGAKVHKMLDWLPRNHVFAGNTNFNMALAHAMQEPSHVGDSEITAKGSLNMRAITQRRKALLERLYDDNDPATIRI